MRNNVMLIGRPAANPVQNDNTTAFDLVVTEKKMNKNTQQWEDDTQRFRCVCEDKKLNTRIMNNVQNGKQVAIDGKLRVIDGKFGCIIVITDLFLIDKPNYE
jgi:single-stranded DNA-binding protein